jgi:hypothetical protein
MNPIAVVIIVLWACFNMLRLAFGLLIVLLGFIIEHPKVMLPIMGILLIIGIGIAIAASQPVPTAQKAVSSPSSGSSSSSSPNSSSPSSSSGRASNSQQQAGSSAGPENTIYMTRSPSPSSSSPPSEEKLRATVKEYYEAVDREDWISTYNILDSRTQQRFTRDEWTRKNQYFAAEYPLVTISPTIVARRALRLR